MLVPRDSVNFRWGIHFSRHFLRTEFHLPMPPLQAKHLDINCGPFLRSPTQDFMWKWSLRPGPLGHEGTHGKVCRLLMRACLGNYNLIQILITKAPQGLLSGSNQRAHPMVRAEWPISIAIDICQEVKGTWNPSNWGKEGWHLCKLTHRWVCMEGELCHILVSEGFWELRQS